MRKSPNKESGTINHHLTITSIVAYTLMVLAFPLNPLVILGVVTPIWDNQILKIAGWCVWAIGMFFVMYPFFYFKRKGGVSKGEPYVKTKKIVTTGLYAVVRHVQYLGGLISIFIATPLLYQHWIFLVIGVPGIFLTYKITQEEDRFLIEKFGDEYKEYMKQVPGFDIFTGVLRYLRK